MNISLLNILIREKFKAKNDIYVAILLHFDFIFSIPQETGYLAPHRNLEKYELSFAFLKTIHIFVKSNRGLSLNF